MGNMTKCKTCSKEIASSARTCPGCGARQGARVGLWILGGFVALIVVGAVGASSKRDKEKSDVAKGVGAIDVTAQQLFDDYEANEVSADAKYRDKVLRVSGKIQRIGKDFTDDGFVELVTSNQFMGVRAEFDGVSALGSLQNGQAVTVRCRGKAKLMGPRLGDCVLE